MKCPNCRITCKVINKNKKTTFKCPECDFFAEDGHGNRGPVKALYAFVVTDELGNEGIPAVEGPGKLIHPLIGGDLQRMSSFIPMVKKLTTNSSQTMKLIKFTTREELEVFKP